MFLPQTQDLPQVGRDAWRPHPLLDHESTASWGFSGVHGSQDGTEPCPDAVQSRFLRRRTGKMVRNVEVCV